MSPDKLAKASLAPAISIELIVGSAPLSPHAGESREGWARRAPKLGLPDFGRFKSLSKSATAETPTTQTGRCAFSIGGDVFGNAVLRLPGQGSPISFNTFRWNGQIPLIADASVLTVTTINVSCTGFNWLALGPKIFAIKVGALH